MTTSNLARFPPPRERVLHPGPLRLTHWLNALAILILIPSGFAIYNAAPFYPIVFPSWLTLGGGLTGALLWHFAAMWLLAVSGATYLLHRVLLRRGGPSLLPVSPREVAADIGAALRLKLGHADGVYNGIQKLFYLGIAAVLAVAVASGFALWKPVQLQGLATLLGGYEAARRIHFWAMAATVSFLIVHLAMVALVPRTLLMMIFGLTAPEPSASPRKEPDHG